ncbi:MAG: branched-chain amino acid ABC transporter permease [Pseudomonadota bacterium]
MHTLFKTSYDTDIDWFSHPAKLGWYLVLLAALLALPLYFLWQNDSYLLGEVTSVFIFAIAGLGLMLLTGQTGLASLGHAAFMAIGCYTNVLLLNAELPWLIAFPLAGLIAGALGTLIALPVMRLHGVYLALATLALSVLMVDFIVLGEAFTGGVAGIAVPDISIFGFTVNRYANPYAFYYVVLAVCLLVVAFYRNILRSPTGRSFAAIRDSEISARAMGVDPAKTKALAFFLSCSIAGLAGALFGHNATYITHETFDIVMSITLLLMIVIGGLGTIHGAFLGAIVVGLIPVLIANARTWLSTSFDITGNIPGIEQAIFAAILIGFILFEPMGLYGRWMKIRTWFDLFPFYRKGMFARQKSYLKTERVQ